jgi:hypothetical protein
VTLLHVVVEQGKHVARGGNVVPLQDHGFDARPEAGAHQGLGDGFQLGQAGIVQNDDEVDVALGWLESASNRAAVNDESGQV